GVGSGDALPGRPPAPEPRLPAALRAAVMRLQELDRDLAIELRVERRVHDAHATGAEHVDDHVAADLRAACEMVFTAGGLGRFARALPFASRRAGRIDVRLVAVVGHTTSIAENANEARRRPRAFERWVASYGAPAALMSFFAFATDTFGLLGLPKPVGDHRKSMWLFSVSVQ